MVTHLDMDHIKDKAGWAAQVHESHVGGTESKCELIQHTPTQTESYIRWGSLNTFASANHPLVDNQ